VVKAISWPIYSREGHGTPFTGDWMGLAAGLDECAKPSPTGYRTPIVQPVSESLYRLSHLGGPNLDENFNTLLTDVWITN